MLFKLKHNRVIILLFYRKEFDLVIQPESQNKSPVIYVDHCLGLESWCVRHVYKYVYQKLITVRKRLKRQGKCKLRIMYLKHI